MSEIIGFHDLEPGLYQVAMPDEVKAVPAPVTLRELDHFWQETKAEKRGEDWHQTVVMLHTGTPGLLLQANAIGAHVHSAVVELDRDRVRVVARGYWMRSDGMLEVIERSKEYDLNAELMKAALKEARAAKGTPSEQQTAAIVRIATEESALALVNTLPVYTKAKVMEKRLEVQGHREALCRTKAENQILRYFIAQAGGILKAKPGVGEVKVTFTRHMLMRKLDSTEVRSAADALYGKQPSGQPSPLVPEGQVPAPPMEDTETVAGEGADQSESDAAAEGQAEEEASPPPPSAESAQPKADKPKLTAKQQKVRSESRNLFTRPAASPGGLQMTNEEGWAACLGEHFGLTGASVLAECSDSDCDAMLKEIAEHAAGELYDSKPKADSPWEDQ